MGKIILDDETLAKLGGVRQSSRLYNQAGELVGYCVSAAAGGELDLGGPDPFSDEDAAEAMRAGPAGKTTAEVLAELRKS